jgi:hypothetical protein
MRLTCALANGVSSLSGCYNVRAADPGPIGSKSFSRHFRRCNCVKDYRGVADRACTMFATAPRTTQRKRTSL